MRSTNARLFWGFLFFLVPVFSVGICIYAAAPGQNWWLPLDISTFGADTDHLFNVILVITTIAFLLTELILCYVLARYGEGETPRRSTFVHGHHKLEVAWSVVPASILVFIAFYQFSTWKFIKFPTSFPENVQKQLREKTPFAEVLAGQFEWRITYPGENGKLGTRDDVHVLNNLHVIRGNKTLIHLRSRDVLHSFYLPNLRLKQDAVPGMTIPVWFEVRQDASAGTYELMCAELCGWGHYKMRGQLTVHPDENDFKAWLKKVKEAEERDTE